MKSTDPLLHAWEATLARKSGTPAIFDSRGNVARTFEEIESEAALLQEKLQDRGRGDVFAIDLGNDPAWPATLLACLRQGLVALPLDESTTAHHRQEMVAFCRHREWSEQPPVLLKLTSGTTAAPRAIRFRSAQLLADCEQICDTMGITDRDVNFGVIPVSHSYGFSNLITPLLARGVALVLSRDRMPRAVLDDLART
ncbi:MAG: class I adenylate-forming enzyme family protein, partial [Chthoniobacterales bacterium]